MTVEVRHDGKAKDQYVGIKQPLPTPNRGRVWNQRQQQTSATAVNPTAMRATTWPLLLPDAVCMARRITESVNVAHLEA
jgi:hypothetical protein